MAEKPPMDSSKPGHHFPGSPASLWPYPRPSRRFEGQRFPRGCSPTWTQEGWPKVRAKAQCQIW